MKCRGSYSLLVAFVMLIIVSGSYIYLNIDADKIRENNVYRNIAEIRPYWTSVRYVLQDAAADALLDYKWDEVEDIGDCTNEALIFTTQVNIYSLYTEDYFNGIFDYLRTKDGKSCVVTSEIADFNASRDIQHIFDVTFDLTCDANHLGETVSYGGEVRVEKQLTVEDVSIPGGENRCKITVTDLPTDTNVSQTKILT